MSSFGNPFTITGASQFTEEGFSRIPKKGQHHFHMTLEMTTPSTNSGTLRQYTGVGMLDLSHIGPQRIKAFKAQATEQFWQDINAIDIGADERATIDSIILNMSFLTSLGTTLSSLEKTVSPVNVDFTQAQYRLMSFQGSQFTQNYVDALQTDATGTGGAGLSSPLPSFSNLPFIGKWVDMRTDPLVVGPQLVVLWDSTMARGNPMQFNTDELSSWFIDIDLITEDEAMSAEDIWFARKLFNQDATNRVTYFRFAQTA